jgi:hypothetical protein
MLAQKLLNERRAHLKPNELWKRMKTDGKT